MFKKKPFKRKYRQSDNFLGFRRIPLSVFGHAPSEKGCAALLGKDLSRARIVVFEIDMSKSVSDSRAFGVEVNGHRVGAAFDSDAFPLFAADLVDAVYIRIETQTIISTKKGLFGREKTVSSDRAQAALFIKVKP